VTGADLLDEVSDALRRYVVFPSPDAYVAVTLWVAATHGQQAWEHATRLGFVAPEKRCGKSRAQSLVEFLCHAPVAQANTSTAALYRSIDSEDPPTLLFDEVDALFGSARKADDNEDLRALLNSGFERGRPARRCVGPMQNVVEFQVFAMACLAGIGMLPDTIADRAVMIHMRRRAPGETVAPFRRRRDSPALVALRERLHEWVRENLDTLLHAEPDMPVEDRAADAWEPLVAVADLAGGTWPQQARDACRALTSEADDPDDSSLGIRLLSDLRGIFEGKDAVHGETILDELRKIDEAPWADLYGRPVTARDVAKILKRYGVRSKDVKIAGEVRKGYRREDLHAPWSAYLPATVTTSATSATSATPHVTSTSEVAGSGSDPLPATRHLSLTSTVAQVAEVADRCTVCGTALDPVLAGHGDHTHPGCAA
jgi:hypothetical protein